MSEAENLRNELIRIATRILNDLKDDNKSFKKTLVGKKNLKFLVPPFFRTVSFQTKNIISP
jgi:hypothetical protein